MHWKDKCAYDIDVVKMNYTIPTQAIDINNNSYFNTGCITEIDKITTACSKFKLDVYHTMELRFISSVITMMLLLFFQLYIKYNKPKFSQTEFWRTKIDYRIDFIIIILLFFNILYIFVM